MNIREFVKVFKYGGKWKRLCICVVIFVFNYFLRFILFLIFCGCFFYNYYFSFVFEIFKRILCDVEGFFVFILRELEIGERIFG